MIGVVTIDEHTEAGRAALEVGRWEEARGAFEAALTEGETPEALEGMGAAFWWLCDARASVRYRERAYVMLRQSGDALRACTTAVDLSITYLVNLGNEAAARGWLARAERVMSGIDPNPMQGWIWEMRGYLTADPNRSRELLSRALEFAHDSGDLDLELIALSDLGLALVVAGRVEEGMAILDEAMAGTLGGEYGRLDTVVFTGCNMLAACKLAGDPSAPLSGAGSRTSSSGTMAARFCSLAAGCTTEASLSRRGSGSGPRLSFGRLYTCPRTPVLSHRRRR